MTVTAVSVPSGRVQGVELVRAGPDPLDSQDSPVKSSGENETPPPADSWRGPI